MKEGVGRNEGKKILINVSLLASLFIQTKICFENYVFRSISIKGYKCHISSRRKI